MRALLLAILLALQAFAAQAQSQADWWYDLSRAGTSLNIAQQGNTFFVAWYKYDESSNPTWIYGTGTLSGSAVPLTLYSARGTFLGETNTVVSAPVGTATLTFVNSNSARFGYAVGGASGTLSLSRFTFQPIDGSGDYLGALVGSVGNCGNPIDNGRWIDSVSIRAAMNNGAPSDLAFTFNSQPMTLICSFSGNFEQIGSRFRVAGGAIHCNNGDWGNWSSENIMFDNDTLAGQLAFVMDGTCNFNGRFSGVRLKDY